MTGSTGRREALQEAVRAGVDGAVALRRRLHAHPELGWTEHYATWQVVQALAPLAPDVLVTGADLYGDVARMGLPAPEVDEAAVRDARAAGVPVQWLDRTAGGRTGVVAVLDSGVPGPEVTLRADIDALAVAESDQPGHRPAAAGFRSRRPGISHACGHDGHAATLTLVAAALRAVGEPHRGRVRLVFQPAEEGARGAAALVDAGWLDGTDVFLCLHNASRDWFTVGDVSEGVHDILATTKLDVHFTGTEAHAALAPERGRSALTAASAVALLMPALPRRSGVQTVTAVGELHAGTSRNVVPGSAVLRTEIRSSDEAEVEALTARFGTMVAGIGAALEVGVRTETVGRAAAADSDPVLMARVGAVIDALPGLRRVPSMQFDASDDAATMMRHVQRRGGTAAYLHVGNAFPGATHSPLFDLDERSVEVGAQVLAAATVDALSSDVVARREGNGDR